MLDFLFGGGGGKVGLGFQVGCLLCCEGGSSLRKMGRDVELYVIKLMYNPRATAKKKKRVGGGVFDSVKEKKN